MHHPAERANGRSYDPIRKGLEQKQDMPAVPKDEPKTFIVRTMSKANVGNRYGSTRTSKNSSLVFCTSSKVVSGSFFSVLMRTDPLGRSRLYR